MNDDWVDVTEQEINDFNNYYHYVESLIAEKEGLINGKFSECFEYSFMKRKKHANIVSYYRVKSKNKIKLNVSGPAVKTIEVIPFEMWLISERRDKLLTQLGI
jgi:hypothetical protein